ncbi:MAG: hypothetical protein IT458_08450 [Planctomycetes bacterium]|nr:hypothetical protein [Planctomycetota bacterium]
MSRKLRTEWRYYLEGVCAKATPGPWIQGQGGGSVIAHDLELADPESQRFYGGAVIAETIVERDIAFVCAARQALPMLLMHSAQLENLVERLRGEISRLQAKAKPEEPEEPASL